MRFAATRRRWSRLSSKIQVLLNVRQFVQGLVPEHFFIHQYLYLVVWVVGRFGVDLWMCGSKLNDLD